MNIVLIGEGAELDELRSAVTASLERNNLSSVITLSESNDPSYKLELGITQNPALAIEETTIDFRDMIFEGMVPDADELDAMFVSILGEDESHHSGGGCGTCSTEGGCGTCDDSAGSCSTC